MFYHRKILKFYILSDVKLNRIWKFEILVISLHSLPHLNSLYPTFYSLFFLFSQKESSVISISTSFAFQEGRVHSLEISLLTRFSMIQEYEYRWRPCLDCMAGAPSLQIAVYHCFSRPFDSVCTGVVHAARLHHFSTFSVAFGSDSKLLFFRNTSQ